MTDTSLSDWLPLVGAAQAIGCSTRTVERLAQAKKLESRLRPQDGTPPVAVYNPSDVARIAAERRRAPAPFVLGAGSDGNGNGRTHTPTSTHIQTRLPASIGVSADDLIRGLALLLSKALQSPPSPTVAANVAETPWIDVPTAAAILGRSQAYVRKQIRDGRLNAERDRCLVVRRKDVEAL